MKTNEAMEIAKGNIYQVIIKDTLDASSYVVHHCLVLREATNIALTMIKSGFEAFIKEDDDEYKMFYSKVGKVCNKLTKKFLYADSIPHPSFNAIDRNKSSIFKNSTLYELALVQKEEFDAAMH